MSSRRKNNKLVDLLSSPGGFKMTQAFTSPITSRLKGGLFNPLEFNPYLLFDAETSMSGTLESPTLDLDPSDESTLDVITATRAGVATYTDLHGNIKQASPDTVRVDYTQGEELTPTKFQNIGYTDFSSGWYTSNVTISTNQDTAPDGTQTAAKYVGSGTSQDSYYNDTFTGPFTYSLFVKYINAPFIRLRNGNTSTWFDLTTVSVATKNHDSAAIKDVGDGWFRISVTVNSSSSFSRAYFYPHTADNTTVEQDGGSFYLWGPQLEEGTTASDFVSNTTGSPKFIASATYADRVPMILVEPSSENLLLYSEDFSNAAWNISGASVVNGISSPDGNNTAFKLTEGTNNGNHYLEDVISNPSQSKQLLSIFIKNAGDNKVVRIATNDAVTGFEYFFNPTTGQVVSDTFTSSNITTLNDGWYRIELLADGSNYVTSGSVPFIIQLSDSSTLSYQGDGTSGVYIWGAQLEEGSVATSYIPTSGSTVTRAADDLVISGSDFTDFYNSSEGTFYVESVSQLDTHNGFIFDVNNGPANRLTLYYPSADVLNVLIRDNTVTSVSLSIGSRPNVGVLSRAAFSYATNDFKGSLDGGSVITDTSVTPPTTVNEMTIGRYLVFGDQNILNGRIKRLLFWPYSSDRL